MDKPRGAEYFERPMKPREEIDREIEVYEARQHNFKLADQIERESVRTSWAWKHPPVMNRPERPSVWDNLKGKWHL